MLIPTSITAVWHHLLHHSSRTVGYVFAFTFLLTFSSYCNLAYAADGSSIHLALADVIYLYEREILSLKDQVVLYATLLLYSLSGFAVIFTGFSLIFLHQGSLQNFAWALVRLCLIIGFFKFFIVNGYDISRDIIASLTNIAYPDHSSNGYQNILNVLQDFFLLADEFAQSLSTRNILFYLFFMLPFFIIIVLIIVNFVITYIITLCVAVIGVIVVALGVLPFTRTIALNYLHMVIAYGLRLFCLCFIYRIGQGVIVTMISRLRGIITQGDLITIQDAGLVLFVMFFILFLSYTMPNIISRLVQPTMIGSIARLQAK